MSFLPEKVATALVNPLTDLTKWGCIICRLHGVKIRDFLQPQLEKYGVKFSGLSFEKVGIEEWQSGKYFDVDKLYLDDGGKIYKELGFGQFSTLRGLAEVAKWSSIQAVREAKALGVGGNFEGNGFQLGGSYIIGPDGEIWDFFHMKTYADEMPVERILETLTKRMNNEELTKEKENIIERFKKQEKVFKEEKDKQKEEVTCSTDSCSVPSKM